MRKCQLCMRAFKARARRSAVQRARRGRWSGDMDMFVDDEERKERSREIHGLCCFLLLFIVFFILSTLILYLRNTKRFKITSQQHLHTLISRFSPTSGSISSNFKNRAIFVAMASRPYISGDYSGGPPPKLGEDRMLLKMRKRWMHGEIERLWRAIEILRWSWRNILGWWDLGFAWREGLGGFVSVGCVFFVHNLRSGTDVNCCCR